MTDDPLLDLKQAAQVLTQELGRVVTYKQLRNAADKTTTFPFFKDPLSKRRVIRKSVLLAAWKRAETQAIMAYGRGRAA